MVDRYSSCNITHWRPSWNFREGRLCGNCGHLFWKMKAHCTKCNYIPKLNNWKKLQALAKRDENGKLVLPCPSCSREASEQFTIVQHVQDEAHECYACQSTEFTKWFRSWNPTEGVLCRSCAATFQASKLHCETCRLVPFRKQIEDEQGRKIFPCRRCASPFTLQLDPCFLYGRFGKQIPQSSVIGQILCHFCYYRLLAAKVYCQGCKYIPTPAELSADPKFATTSNCRKFRQTQD